MFVYQLASIRRRRILCRAILPLPSCCRYNLQMRLCLQFYTRLLPHRSSSALHSALHKEENETYGQFIWLWPLLYVDTRYICTDMGCAQYARPLGCQYVGKGKVAEHKIDLHWNFVMWKIVLGSAWNTCLILIAVNAADVVVVVLVDIICLSRFRMRDARVLVCGVITIMWSTNWDSMKHHVCVVPRVSCVRVRVRVYR